MAPAPLRDVTPGVGVVARAALEVTGGAAVAGLDVVAGAVVGVGEVVEQPARMISATSEIVITRIDHFWVSFLNKSFLPPFLFYFPL